MLSATARLGQVTYSVRVHKTISKTCQVCIARGLEIDDFTPINIWRFLQDIAGGLMTHFGEMGVENHADKDSNSRRLKSLHRNID